MGEPKKISELEYQKSETFRHRIELIHAEMRIIEAKIEAVNERKKVFMLQAEATGLQRFELSGKKQALVSELKRAEKERNEFADQVKERLGIEGENFSFNPETLEVEG